MASAAIAAAIALAGCNTERRFALAIRAYDEVEAVLEFHRCGFEAAEIPQLQIAQHGGERLGPALTFFQPAAKNFLARAG